MQSNPWISIWTKPRSTIAQIAEHTPNRSLWPLAAIYGFCTLMNLFQAMSLGSSFSVGAILLLGALLAPFWGYVSFSVWSWAMLFVGKWLHGRAGFSALRSTYAWSCVPLFFNIPLWLLTALVFGKELFMNFQEPQAIPSMQVGFLFVVMLIKVVLAVWSLIIYLTGVSEVQGFSLLKAVVNLVLATVLLAALFFVVNYAIAMLLFR